MRRLDIVLERIDVPQLIFDLERVGVRDAEIRRHCRVQPSAVYSWKMGDKRPRLDQGLALLMLHAWHCWKISPLRKATGALSPGHGSEPTETTTMKKVTKSGKRKTGGGDAVPTPKADESTTRVAGAVGLPDPKAARAELERHPARHSVLSTHGHVVRD